MAKRLMDAPLAVVLCLQAALLFVHLELLPLWTDELFTVQTVARPLPEIVRIVGSDIHPPLYYVLLRGWSQLPLPWDGVALLRAFSAAWALAATVLLDRLWTRHWRPPRRWTALALVALSPCLLLYARMARSYAMQMALAILVVGLLRRWLRRPDSRGYAAVGAGAALLALLYTHYVPGLALLGAFLLTTWRRLGWRRVCAFAGAVAAGYLPWLLTLTGALRRWGEASGSSSNYTLSGSAVLEQPVKIAFGVVSLTIGESFAVASLALVPVLAVLALRGAWLGFRRSTVPLLLVLAAAAGYVGVARWVSYPFIPARLLWLLPFVCLAVAVGLNRRPLALRRAIAAAVLASYLSSAWLYFRKENYLNLGYSAPLREIAGQLDRGTAPGEVILFDTFNTDAACLRHYLSRRATALEISAGDSAGPLKRASGAPGVWIVHNTRDVSPGGLTTRVEREACAGRSREDSWWHPYAPWQRSVLRMVSRAEPPSHFYQVTVCRAP